MGVGFWRTNRRTDMRGKLIIFAFGACVILVAGVFAMIGLPSRKVPDKYEPIGSFEIVTHTIRYRTGWNEGRLGRGTTETYGLRYRGEPLTIEGKSGMFGQDTRVYERMNMIVTFPAREPAILVNVGDPNNSSFYYLVRERDGKPLIEYVGDDSGGISVDWLDPAPAEIGGERDIAVHRKHLEGGRFLLLGAYCVLDVETFRAYRFSWDPGGSVVGLKSPLGMSPDRNSFVRLGDDKDGKSILLVFDFVDATSYAVPIDRATQRFSVIEQIDADWIAYYFEWVSPEGAHDRFVARSGITPRAWAGVTESDPNGLYHEYSVSPVKEELRRVIIDYFIREMGAELQPRAQYSDVDPLKFEERVVKVSYWNGQVALWMDMPFDAAFIDELGTRVDRLLATGELDEYFVE